MKQKIRRFLVLLAGYAFVWHFVSPIGAQGQNGHWTVQTYAEDGFKASFPLKPEITVDQDSDFKTVRTYRAIDGPAVLIIEVSHYHDASPPSQEAADEGMTAGIELARRAVHADLVDRGSISVGGHRGMRYETENKKYHFSGFMVIVGTVSYHEFVQLERGTIYPTKRFLDSFQLLPPK